jgi:hypothetical protein
MGCGGGEDLSQNVTLGYRAWHPCGLRGYTGEILFSSGRCTSDGVPFIRIHFQSLIRVIVEFVVGEFLSLSFLILE